MIIMIMMMVMMVMMVKKVKVNMKMLIMRLVLKTDTRLGSPSNTTLRILSVKGGGVPPKSVTPFLPGKKSVKGGGSTPLTDKIRKVVFEGLPKQLGTFLTCMLHRTKSSCHELTSGTYFTITLLGGGLSLREIIEHTLM